MTDEKRIGVISSERNAVWLDEALSGRLTAMPLEGGTLEETLSHYQAINVRTVVVDDDLLYGYADVEEDLARWAKSHGHPRVRIVLFMDSGRPVDDPYLFRLVSDAEVHDILVVGENGEPAARLLHLIDEPMAPIEYERWRTNDPAVWQQRKPGLLESIFGSPRKKDKGKKKKPKKGKPSAKQKKQKKAPKAEEDAMTPVEDFEATVEPRAEAGEPTGARPSGQEQATVVMAKGPEAERVTARTGEPEPPTPEVELGDVASVYGIELDDAEEAEVQEEEQTGDGRDMRESKAKAEEKKKVTIDLGSGDATGKTPKAETPKARPEKEPQKGKKSGERRTDKEKAKGTGTGTAQGQAEKADVAKEKEKSGHQHPEARQETPEESTQAVVREVVETVVEDVRAHAAASPAPGTVTLTFPGSSLSSILESFVRPGAERRQGVSFPTAKNVVAVSALRPGMGCSHVSVALGVALASEHVSVAVALRTRFNVSRMLDGLSDSYETNGVGVKWRGCDFYYWEDQRTFSSEYDVVIADCGVLDTSDNSRNSPTNLFVNHARVGIMLMGGSPWDLPLLDGLLSRFEARTTREWRFGCCRTTPEMLASLENTFAEIYRDGKKRMWAVPYSPSLFDGSTPRFAAYRDVLEPVLPKPLRYSKSQAKVQEGAPGKAGPAEADSERAQAKEPEETPAKAADVPGAKPEKDGNRPKEDVEGRDPNVKPDCSSVSAPEGQLTTPAKEKKPRKRSHNERAASKARSNEE